MRRLAAFAAALLLAGAALAETTLRRANGNEPSTLDPQKYELIAESNILREVFEGLTTQDADNNIIPGQAESWTMSPTAWSGPSSCATGSSGRTGNRPRRRISCGCSPPR